MPSLRVGLLAILVGGYACGGSSTEPSGTSTNQSSPLISIVDFSFNAATVTVKPGTQVQWTNDGQTGHTTTSDTGLWDSRVISGNSGGVYGGGASGGSYLRAFVQVGEFPYHCSVHPYMKGTVIVAE